MHVKTQGTYHKLVCTLVTYSYGGRNKHSVTILLFCKFYFIYLYKYVYILWPLSIQLFSACICVLAFNLPTAQTYLTFWTTQPSFPYCVTSRQIPLEYFFCLVQDSTAASSRTCLFPLFVNAAFLLFCIVFCICASSLEGTTTEVVFLCDSMHLVLNTSFF